MTVRSSTLQLSTRGNGDVQDITRHVAQIVKQSGLVDGIVTVFCPSSTSALTTIEYEPGAVSDFKRLFDEIVPIDRTYAHDAAWGDGNGHSHVRAALLGATFAIPFIAGRLTLGTWQQLIHIDFDTRPRKRELVIMMMGE